jgi:hypothetical protein
LRDRKAKTLPGHFYDCLEGSEFAEIQPRYVIYLRPFATTGRLTLRNPKRGWLPFTPSYFENRKNIELETAFAAALEPVIPVVGLGRAGEHVGVGHIETSDQGWWDLFCTLIDGAEWILMLPAWKGETRRELEYVRSPQLLHKTVFVMPPRLSGSQIDMPSYWDTLQDQAREMELRLPDYTPVGELFTLENNGTVRRLRPIGRPTEERLRDAFLSITRGHRVSD